MGLRRVCFVTGLSLLVVAAVRASHAAEPSSVAVMGTFQTEMGCATDWQVDCAATALSFDATDSVWQAVLSVPAGSWEYKVVLDGGAAVYGLNAEEDGASTPLAVSSGAVKLYYDHATHWATDSVRGVAVAVGSFQNELGCPADWQPDCLLTWLKDPDGDGLMALPLATLAPGSYEMKVAMNETWDENYGRGGALNGASISFEVPPPAPCLAFVLSYDASTHLLVAESTPTSEGEPCDDGQFCTLDDVCTGGVCVGSGDPCAGGGECADVCDEAADSCFAPLGAPCGNPADTACTAPDSCDGNGACRPLHAANGSPCDNGLFCDGAEQCDDGVCRSAGDPCVSGVCSESAHLCSVCGDGVVSGDEACDDAPLQPTSSSDEGCRASAGDASIIGVLAFMLGVRRRRARAL